jgi:signal transduction histidine kinase
MSIKEQTSLELRAAAEREVIQAQMREQCDSAQLNEISRINNELVNAQRELAGRNAELERLNQALNEAHGKAQELLGRLERSNRDLEEFASIASHDLQEPLRAIQAFSGRLQNKHAQSLDEQGSDYLARIQKAATRMQTLIGDLLTLARLTTKVQPFALVNLADVSREVVSDLEARIQQSGGQVEVSELRSLEADPLQMRQLLQNLIGNALKFHRPGTPPVVRVGRCGCTTCDRVCIEVADNGIGFSEEDLKRIFLPFERLNGRSKYEGTGIGLTICRKIVERHGGCISATSVPGQGSRFVIELPLRQPEITPGDMA